MNPNLASLANLMQAKFETGQKFTLLLGAGASFSSNVMPTDKLMVELLDRFGKGITGDDLRDRFDQLWANTSESDRALYLKPYLARTPSAGYADLAELIKAGFFDIIVTFNYDNLVEMALQAAGLRNQTDYVVIVRGDHRDDRVLSMAEGPEPRIKVIKLHGSMWSGNTFLFSRDEMLNYPEPISGLVKHATRKDILVCGYAFEDICVLRAFSDEGESIYCVNPRGAPTNLRGFMRRRRSAQNVFDGDDGKFDGFFGALRQQLLKESVQPSTVRPSVNPFKFLEGYEQDEAGTFLGRRALARRVVARIKAADCRVLHVVGPAKSGKTSFIRAGVNAMLCPDVFEPVYVRSTRRLEQDLVSILGERFNKQPADNDLATVLGEFGTIAPEKRVVLILDQFERFFRRFPDTDSGRREMSDALRKLGTTGAQNLTVVTAGIDDTPYLKRIIEQRAEMIDVPRLEPKRVTRIVRILANKAGLVFEDRVVSALQERYTHSSPGPYAFTLAHIQALCSILYSRPQGNLKAWEEVMGEHLDSLNQAINQCDVLSFIEDCPFDEQRAILCKILRIVSEPGRGQIVDFLKNHFEELIATRRSNQQRRTHAAGL